MAEIVVLPLRLKLLINCWHQSWALSFLSPYHTLFLLPSFFTWSQTPCPTSAAGCVALSRFVTERSHTTQAAGYRDSSLVWQEVTSAPNCQTGDGVPKHLWSSWHPQRTAPAGFVAIWRGGASPSGVIMEVATAATPVFFKNAGWTQLSPWPRRTAWVLEERPEPWAGALRQDMSHPWSQSHSQTGQAMHRPREKGMAGGPPSSPSLHPVMFSPCSIPPRAGC